MATKGASALVLLRSLWEKHVLLLRPQMAEAQREVVADMSRRGLAVSGIAVEAQCRAAAKHLEAVLRATLNEFQERARPDGATRRYVARGEAEKHLKAMLAGEARLSFGGPGSTCPSDSALVVQARGRTLIQLASVVESELGVIAHKLHAPALDRRFWAEKGTTVGIAIVSGVIGWVANSTAGQKLIDAVLRALHLK